MAEPKTIYCPKCGRQVAHYDGKQTINPRGKCKKCKHVVVYDIKKDDRFIEKIPQRHCSSGMTFI